MDQPQFLEEWIDGSTICRESSAVGIVWSIYEGCLNFLAKLVPLLSARRSTASTTAVLKEELGKLLSWGDGFEDGELDRTMERDPGLKSTALEYLCSLGSLLADKLFVLPVYNSEGRDELEAEVVQLRSLVNNARTIIDDSEDDASDFDYETKAKSSNRKAVFDETAADIKFYILRLMDLLPSVERTALISKELQEPNFDTSRTPVSFQVSRAAFAYVLQIRDKFPEADNKLIERLGEANWQRRLRIRKEPQELAEIASAESANSVFMPVSMFHDSGLGTSVLTKSAYTPTAVSHSSFQTSATENQSGTYRVPPTPQEVLDNVPFTCEICGHVLRNIKSRVDWKIHVFADLKPYICTFPSCSDEMCTFPTRQLWANHEFRKHRVDKFWHCYLCPAQLLSPGLLEEHLKQVHSTNLNPDQLRKAIATAETTRAISIESQSCLLCHKTGMKSRKEFVTHVAKHMENVALAALPRDADSESGSDVASCSSNSSEASAISGGVFMNLREVGRQQLKASTQNNRVDQGRRISTATSNAFDENSQVSPLSSLIMDKSPNLSPHENVVIEHVSGLDEDWVNQETHTEDSATYAEDPPEIRSEGGILGILRSSRDIGKEQLPDDLDNVSVTAVFNEGFTTPRPMSPALFNEPDRSDLLYYRPHSSNNGQSFTPPQGNINRSAPGVSTSEDTHQQLPPLDYLLAEDCDQCLFFQSRCNRTIPTCGPCEKRSLQCSSTGRDVPLTELDILNKNRFSFSDSFLDWTDSQHPGEPTVKSADSLPVSKLPIDEAVDDIGGITPKGRLVFPVPRQPSYTGFSSGFSSLGSSTLVETILGPRYKCDKAGCGRMFHDSFEANEHWRRVHVSQGVEWDPKNGGRLENRNDPGYGL